MTIYKHTNGYFHYDNGRKGSNRIFFSTGQKNRRIANTVVRSKLINLSGTRPEMDFSTKQALPSSLPPAGFGPLPIGHVATLYLKSAHRTQRRTERDEANYQQIVHRVKTLVDRFGPDTDLFSLTTDDMELFVEELEQKGYAGATINHYATNALRPLFTFANKRLGKKDPCRIYWEAIVRLAEQRIRYLKKEEMERLFASMPRREAVLHQFACITGLRAREMIYLRWSEVDWHNRLFTTTVKGRKKHTLPLTNKLERLLLELFEDRHEEFVFSYVASKTLKNNTSIRGKLRPYTYSALYSRFRSALEKAKIEDYRFHDHRHTAATLLFLSTKNIRLVQTLLGHSDVSHCNRYLHLDVGLLASEMEIMDMKDFPHYVLAYSPYILDAVPDLESDLRKLRLENAMLVDRLNKLTAETKTMGLRI